MTSSIANLLSNLPTTANQNIWVAKDDDGVVTRWQRHGPGGFAMLLRMPIRPYHLCGYVLVDETKWSAVDDGTSLELGHTYDGPGTRDISWRVFNQNRRLVVPVKLAPEGEADYWIGFDLQSRPTLDVASAVSILDDFVERVSILGVLRK